MSAEERVIFDEVKAALATEQREHWNTQMRLSALQDEVAEERRLNNASLKPSQCVAAEDTQPTDTDLTRARARTKVLKRENAELTQIIETLELVEVALRTDVSRLEGYKTKLEKSNTRLKGVLGISELTLCAVRNEHKILQDSAKTQANFMEQVDAACKIAEAKVQEQRKEIAALTINADRCAICESTQMEEITNRDAVILQYEIRAEDREEIIKALAKEIKVMRAPEMHKEYQQLAYCVRPFTIGFVGKREDMPNIERNKCRYFNTCDYAKRENHTCADGGGEYCGVWRHKEARQ